MSHRRVIFLPPSVSPRLHDLLCHCLTQLPLSRIAIACRPFSVAIVTPCPPPPPFSPPTGSCIFPRHTFPWPQPLIFPARMKMSVPRQVVMRWAGRLQAGLRRVRAAPVGPFQWWGTASAGLCSCIYYSSSNLYNGVLCSNTCMPFCTGPW